MPDILDIIDKDATPEEQMDSIRKNFTMVSKSNLKAGTYQLLNLKVNVAQNISTATYSNLSQFAGSFNSSGGLVSFVGNVLVATSGNLTVLELYIDDVAQANFTQSSTTLVYGSVAVLFSTMLNAGNHTWRIKAKVDTGTTTIGYLSTSGSTSNISITESLRG